MFDLKNAHLQPTERKLLWFLCRLMTHGPSVLSERENFVHSLSLFFSPLFMHLAYFPQATKTAKNFFLLPVANLVNILSDFLYYCILAPCTNRKNVDQKYRDYNSDCNCSLFTVALFYYWHRRCGVDNHHVQAGGQTQGGPVFGEL